MEIVRVSYANNLLRLHVILNSFQDLLQKMLKQVQHDILLLNTIYHLEQSKKSLFRTKNQDLSLTVEMMH